MAISSYSIARALLKEKYALNAKTTQEALLDSRTCLRYFPGIPMGKVSECLDCLRTIASVKNTKASHTVLNPEVNKEELPGTWRHVQEYAEPPRAKTEPDVQDVYQLLKLGVAHQDFDCTGTIRLRAGLDEINAECSCNSLVKNDRVDESGLGL